MRFVLLAALCLWRCIVAFDGFQVAITKAGGDMLLHNANNHLIPVIKSQTGSLHIDPIGGDADAPLIGGVHYTLDNFRLSKFNASEDASSWGPKLDHQNQLVVTWNDISAQIDLDFHWSHEIGWGYSTDGSGSASVIAFNGQIQVTLELGNIYAKIVDVQVHFDDFNIQVHSDSADWLYQPIADALHDQVSAAANSALEDNLKNFLSSQVADFADYLPKEFSILSDEREVDVKLDYDNEIVTNNSISLHMDILFLASKDHNITSRDCLKGTQLPEAENFGSQDFQAFAVLEEGTVNCALELMSRANMLNTQIMLPRLSIFNMLFPFHRPYLVLSTDFAPTLHISTLLPQNQIQAEVPLNMQVRDTRYDVLLGLLDTNTLLTFNISAFGSVYNESTGQFENPRLHFSLVALHTDIKSLKYGVVTLRKARQLKKFQLYSNVSVAQWIDQFLSLEINVIIESFLHENVGAVLSQGISLPVPGFLGFTNPQIRTFGSHFMVTSNLNLTF